jgi:protein TonB
MPLVLSEPTAKAVIRKLPLLESGALEGMPATAPAIESRPESSNRSDSRPGRSLEPARLLKRVIPVYPPLAKTAPVQGAVILEAAIAETGAIDEVNVISGHPLLIRAAVDAIRQWRYEPAKLDGIPTRSLVEITVNFDLSFSQ